MTAPAIHDLLDRWEESRRRGINTPAEDLCRDCPELLDELRKHIAALASMDGWLNSTAPDNRSASATRSKSDSADAQRYEPMKKHAQGGLGEVYLAKDHRLNRPVAIKRIQPRHGDNQNLQERFLREAAITARLQHPGIVPIYDLTHDADGHPSYAMRFVEGDSLEQAISKFHSDVAPATFNGVAHRQLLSRFVSVCNTIAYAHSRGVIHRDIKPANIILGEFGETLVVDWGLAKAVGSDNQTEQSENEFWNRLNAESGPSPSAELTMLGTALGTPAYMSPEQAAGDTASIGPRSDVFSLGATLYHLLTGRAPIVGETWPQLRQKILTSDFPTPRSINPHIPRPLEAICRKAMANQPDRRYASALELAADVEHWLADQPVQAWREPWTIRAQRWMRHHRTLVTTGVAALLLSAVSLAAGLYFVDAERRQTEKRRIEAVESEHNTLMLFDGMMSNEAVDRLLREEKLTAQQIELIKTVQSRFEKVIGDGVLDADRRANAGRVFFQIGRLKQRLREYDAAIALFDRAIAVFGKLATEFPNQPNYRRSLAHSLNCRAMTLFEIDQPDRLNMSLKAHEQARNMRQQLVADHPSNLEYVSELAASCNNLAGVLWQLDDKPASLSAYKQAERLYAQLAKNQTNHAEHRVHWAQALTNLSDAYINLGMAADADDSCRQAIAILKAINRQHPDQPSFQRAYAEACNNHGSILQALSDFDAAAASYRETIAGLKVLVEKYPGDGEYALILGGCYGNVGNLLAHQGNLIQAVEAFGQAVRILEPIRQQMPNDQTVREFNGNTRMWRGEVLIALGWYDLALADWTAAQTLCPPEKQPLCSARRIQCLLQLGRFAEAIQHLLMPLDSADTR